MSQHTRRRPFRPAIEALEARAVPSVCTVDRLNDLDEGKAGRGSLRYCVTESLFRADTINFEVKGVINLTRALPNLTRSVSIEGPGADLLTVRRDLGNYYRVFTVAAGAVVGISGLTIINGHGYESPGGGIDNFGTLTIIISVVSESFASVGGGGVYNTGALVVSSSTISSNTTGGGSKDAGGIYNSGTLTISDSTISGNSGGGGSGRGGGIFNSGRLTVGNSTISGNATDSSSGRGGEGAGIFNSGGGTMTLTNTTISGNSAGGSGGGGIFNSGTLAVSNSTVSGNTSLCGSCVGSDRRGGGIYGGGAMAVRNTIIAGNTALAGPDVFGNLGSRGHNLIGNPQDASGWVESDLLHVAPRLGPLQDNGGPTPTHALLPGSPAVDAGDNKDAPESDQRGLPRVTGNVIDIGAFEVQPGPVAFFYLAAPETALAGMPFDLAVLAFDAGGYLATNYTGTVAFYSATDPDAVLPEAYTFTASDAGVAYLPESAALYAEGLQEVLVYDVEAFAVGLAFVEVFAGDGPNPGWGYQPDAAALLALLTEQTRLRP